MLMRNLDLAHFFALHLDVTCCRADNLKHALYVCIPK
jgi:hypothetical protein